VARLHDAVVALWRSAPGDDARVLALHNVRGEPVSITATMEGAGVWRDLIGEEAHEANDTGELTMTLRPYQIAWLKAE
jgi:hypothetical protein